MIMIALHCVSSGEFSPTLLMGSIFLSQPLACLFTSSPMYLAFRPISFLSHYVSLWLFQNYSLLLILPNPPFRLYYCIKFNLFFFSVSLALVSSSLSPFSPPPPPPHTHIHFFSLKQQFSRRFKKNWYKDFGLKRNQSCYIYILFFPNENNR